MEIRRNIGIRQRRHSHKEQYMYLGRLSDIGRRTDTKVFFSPAKYSQISGTIASRSLAPET